MSSVYSTVPNSNEFFKQYQSKNNETGNNNNFNENFVVNFNKINNNNNAISNGIGNDAIRATKTLMEFDNDSLLNNEDFHIALTPPNTPTHGVIIKTIEPSDDIKNNNNNNYFNDDDEEIFKCVNNPFNQPKLFNDSTQSSRTTPIDLRSMCDTPDSQEPQWNIPQLNSQSNSPKWNELNIKGKCFYLLKILLKFLSILLLLYTFICSLELLSIAFRLLGARVIGNFFQNNQLLLNPIVGLMIGVLVTVLVQSSSTSTSITVTMVASRIIHVRQAIPIMMGANIGTSVTNTIVSLMQSADRNEFGRAFAAATVHDMFNWLTVIILLPMEMLTHYLEFVTTFIVNKTSIEMEKNPQNPEQTTNQKVEEEKQFLNHLTKPLTNRIIQIDKDLLEEMAYGNQSLALDSNRHLLIRCCDDNNIPCHLKCSLFGWLGFADTPTGLILLCLSILILCLCLMTLVKILNSLLTGQISKLIKRTMNREYQFPYSLIADYSSILIGCILTILVQSSSIFTSALTPLAGIGIITLERIYPLTLGANIGTTTTGILAALASERNRLHDTMQIALCHLFFNVTGILLFYPIPFMRLPIPMAKLLGQITAKYRWFSIFYLLIMFFILPLIIFSLSTLGITIMLMILIPIIIMIILIIIINLLQIYYPHCLPLWLKNWHFLPLYLRSLDPLDNFIMNLSVRFKCMNCFATSGQLQHIRFERGNDGNKLLLGHNSDTTQSRLNILESNSEQNLNGNSRNHQRNRNNNFYYQQPSVQETIKKVISKLTNHQQNNNRRRFNSHCDWNYKHQQSSSPPLSFDNETSTSTNNWSLFNSHTIHIGSQLHRYHLNSNKNRYKNLPFTSLNDNNEFSSITNQKNNRDNNNNNDKIIPLESIKSSSSSTTSQSPKGQPPLTTIEETKML